MTTIKEMIRQANEDGYVDDNAEAKVCQDVVLKAISESSLSRKKYAELINNDLFLQLVWDCYAWMIFQRIPIPLKDGTYRFIPGADLHSHL